MANGSTDTSRRILLAARILLGAGLLAVALITRGFTRLPAIYYMTGPSMEPTVLAGEYFTTGVPDASRLARGQLVLFRYEDEDGVFHVLRRLAGLPGDTVAMRDGRIVVNGAPQPWPFRIVEPRAAISPLAREPNLYTWGPVVVPPDSLILLADTRDVIGWPDSRFLGPVPRSAIVTAPRRIVWSPRQGRMLRRLDAEQRADGERRATGRE